MNFDSDNEINLDSESKINLDSDSESDTGIVSDTADED